MGLSTPIILVPLFNLFLPLIIAAVLPSIAKIGDLNKYLTNETLTLVKAVLISYALIFGLIQPVASLATYLPL